MLEGVRKKFDDQYPEATAFHTKQKQMKEEARMIASSSSKKIYGTDIIDPDTESFYLLEESMKSCKEVLNGCEAHLYNLIKGTLGVCEHGEFEARLGYLAHPYTG